MWDPPRPGLEPVSPALAGGFSTTAPPGKPETHFLNADSQAVSTDLYSDPLRLGPGICVSASMIFLQIFFWTAYTWKNTGAGG